jgi:hypothetical protein
MGRTPQEVKELLRSHADPPRWTKWLLEFAEKNLEECKARDWDQIGKELKDCFESTYDIAYFWKEPQSRPSSEFLRRLEKGVPKELKDHEELKKIQSALREGLKELVPDKLREISSHVGRWKVPVEIMSFELVSLVVEKGKGRRTRKTRIGHVYSTGWPGIFWLLVADLLEQEGSKLHRCTQCRKLYWKFKRQAYCSQKCSQQLRTRKYYEAHHEELKDKRHERYAQQKREELGTGTKVRRNRPVVTTKKEENHGTQERKR